MSQRNLSVSSRKLDFENWKIYNSLEPRMNATCEGSFPQVCCHGSGKAGEVQSQ